MLSHGELPPQAAAASLRSSRPEASGFGPASREAGGRVLRKPFHGFPEHACRLRRQDGKRRCGMLSQEDREMAIRVAAFERGYEEGREKSRAMARKLGALLSEAGRREELIEAFLDERKMAELVEEFGIE